MRGREAGLVNVLMSKRGSRLGTSVFVYLMLLLLLLHFVLYFSFGA